MVFFGSSIVDLWNILLLYIGYLTSSTVTFQTGALLSGSTLFEKFISNRSLALNKIASKQIKIPILILWRVCPMFRSLDFGYEGSSRGGWNPGLGMKNIYGML